MPLPGPTSAFPEATSIELITLDEVQFPAVRTGIEYWRMLRGSRRFPARDDICARDIVAILPNMVLVEVIDGGNDFLLKIVGDEVGRSYRAPLNKRRMSEIENDLPNIADRWSTLYRQVAQTGLPLAVRITVGLEGIEINFTQGETVCLPLGPSDNCVDHLVTFGKRTACTAQFSR